MSIGLTNKMHSPDFIDKTTYLAYRQCPKNAWFKVNKPELHGLFELSEFEKGLSIMGHEVEMMAQKMFPDGVLMKSFEKDAADVTRQHIDHKTPILFQPTFVFEDFLARSDILTYDETNDQWNLYEIKASNSIKDTDRK